MCIDFTKKYLQLNIPKSAHNGGELRRHRAPHVPLKAFVNPFVSRNANKTNFKDPLTFFTTLGPSSFWIYQKYQFKNKFIFQGSAVLRCTTASCAGPRLRPTRRWASPARSLCTRSRRMETTRFPAKVRNDDRISWKNIKLKNPGGRGVRMRLKTI